MPIRRFILLLSLTGLALLVTLLGAYRLMDSRGQLEESRVFRGRSLLDTENYLSAVEVLRDVPVGGANNSEAHSYLGAAYYRLHLYQAAIKEFEEAVRQRSGAVDGWLGLAATYVQLGDWQKAMEPAGKATGIEKNSADAWIVLGRAHWLQRSFGEAEKAGLKALEVDPKNPVAAELLLHIYSDLNQPDKFQPLLDRQTNPSKSVQDLAAQFFARQGGFVRAWEYRSGQKKRDTERSALQSELALKREPGTADLIPALVRDLVELGRADEAIATAEKYKGPASLDLELGKAYLLTGRNAEAVRAFERASAARVHKLSAEVALAALTRDPRHWREAFRAERIEKDYFIFSRLEDVLKTASPIEKAFIYRYAGVFDPYFYNKAAEAALAVLNQAPIDFDAMMTIATSYHRLGRIDDAVRYVESARENYPNRSEIFSRLGSLSVAQGSPQKAAEYMEKAVQLDPSDANALYNLGWIYDQTGDAARATGLYERAIKASPLSYEAMNNLAVIYQNSERAELARDLLDRAVRVDPENEAVYFNLADYYVRQRASRQALDNYARAFETNPDNAFGPVEMGRIYLEMGEPEQALEKLNQALDIDPYSFDAYTVLQGTYEKLGRPKEAAAALEEARRIRPDAKDLGKESK